MKVIKRESEVRDATTRTRTWDYLVNSEGLYQLSYGGSGSCLHFFVIGFA